MSLNLSELAAAASGGWSVSRGTVQEVQAAALRAGWSEVSMRSNDSPHSILRPVAPKEGRRNSMSAVHGLDEQPLHTDGAHLRRPPDWIALIVEKPNSTPTKLWRPQNGSRPVPWAALENGVFLVKNGSERFLASIKDVGRLRYDPTSMTPCDLRAVQAAAFFVTAEADVEEHPWIQENEILLIDNRKALHGRKRVTDPADRSTRVVHRLAFQTEKP